MDTGNTPQPTESSTKKRLTKKTEMLTLVLDNTYQREITKQVVSGNSTFNTKSEKCLVGVHPDLVRVVRLALTLTTIPFGITEGLRSVARQKILVQQKKSTTMKSRHITGHAIDVVAYVNGKVSWDWKYYSEISVAFKKAAAQLNILVEWGGDWKSFPDGPHYQLSDKAYPAGK